jgi:hypothetical protein
MIIYLDESGCPGFKFDRPYLQGGSSRYFTIAAISLPDRNFISDLETLHLSIYTRHRWNPNNEKKSSDIKKGWQKRNIAASIADLIIKKPEIGLHAITVYKPNVTVPGWQSDKNKMYNYMIRLLFLAKITANNDVHLLYDERNMNVITGKTLESYLLQEISRSGKTTTFNAIPQKSHENKGIIMADYLANLIFCKYEFAKNFHIPITGLIDERPLFHQ